MVRHFILAALAALILGAGNVDAAEPENTLYLELEYGRVVIEMRPDLAPGHVARIKELVRQGFYDGVVFHRVIEGFMAQTGDPTGTGTGGSGQRLKAEFNSEPHVRGTLSMARARSNMCQWASPVVLVKAIPGDRGDEPEQHEYQHTDNALHEHRADGFFPRDFFTA